MMAAPAWSGATDLMHVMDLLTDARAASRRIAPGSVRVTSAEGARVVVIARPATAEGAGDQVVIYAGDDPAAALAALRETYPEKETA